MKQRMSAVYVGVLFLLAACGDPEPAKQPDDQGSPDAGQDMPDLVVEPDEQPDQDMSADLDMPICEPTSCQASECGPKPDGCGGELDCGQCLCVDGVPQLPSCGQCELGQLDCGRPDGMPACTQPTLPDGVRLDCERLIYLDPSAGAPGDGTRGSPFKSFDDALAKALGAGSGAIIWAGDGVIESSKEFKLPEAVHILGGFEPTRFVYNPARKPTLRVAATQPADGAVLVENVLSKTWLHHIRIEATGSVAGQTLHGMRVVSSPGLVLSEVDVVVGDGAAGMAGASGASGQSGVKGRDGRADAQLAVGGGPGAACAGMGSLGGFGGLGSTEGAGRGGQPGLASAGGGSQGGAGGPGGMMSPQVGAAGGNGVAHTMGAQAGAPGQPAARVEAGRLVVAGAGAQGARGDAGGGGGGGGGAPFCASPRCQPSEIGPSGGGGGGGGCGGEGGQGGGVGASVVALLLVETSDAQIVSSTFTAGKGGRGGQGGPGGAGGAGGEGGKSVEFTVGNTLIASGRGGNGAAGQRGGQGGGGAGGSSYGIWCENSRLRDLEAQAAVTVNEGGKGVQGASDGISEAFHGCMP